jgi:hypothetical protein
MLLHSHSHFYAEIRRLELAAMRGTLLRPGLATLQVAKGALGGDKGRKQFLSADPKFKSLHAFDFLAEEDLELDLQESL